MNENRYEIENKWQKMWKDSEIFETIVDKSKVKYFGNAAYPYANSVLHIGHGRTYILTDIYLRYQRVLGKNVLFPMGYHISGTPVLAVADGIKENNEKTIKQVRDAISDYIDTPEEQDKLISTFTNPENIAEFFSSKIEQALDSVGCGISYKRSFTTGEPIYNKFVEWQFSKLKEKGLLTQGKYPILYSPKDKNAVGEDDIKDGDLDKVSISEMELIKFRLNKFPKIVSYDKNKNIIDKQYLGTIISKGDFFSAAHTMIIDKNNNIVLQVSSSNVYDKGKFNYSGGGIVEKGDINETAIEEVEEEIGIKIKKEDLKNCTNITYKKDNTQINIHRNLFFLKVDYDLKDYQIKNSEVEKIEHMSIEKFEEKLKNNSNEFSKYLLKEKDIILENLNKLKNEKGVKIEFSKEDKSNEFEKEYICCATLRSDSLFGATNLYVKPEMELSKLQVGDEIWYVSKQAQLKIENQFDNVSFIENLKGENLIGKNVFVPISEKIVPIYEADFCDDKHGTGIVYSSPADSVHDYLYLFETLHKGKNLEDFKDEDPLNLNPITQTFNKKGKLIGYKKGIPSYSKLFEHKIFSSKNNLEKLDLIKKELYKEAHFGAKMINCGEQFDNVPLKNNVAFNKVNEVLKELKLGETLYETSRRAETRGGDNVVVANLSNQWFLDYSKSENKEIAKKVLEKSEFFPKNLKQTQQNYIDWVRFRPCARKRGLGTKIPYDKDWIIEPLSDSTIYQMLYMISHLIRKYDIKSEQLTFDFFDFIYSIKEKPKSIEDIEKDTNLDKKIIEECRDEIKYWKNVDFRYVGLPHMSNHLNFLIYHYGIIFPKSMWPNKLVVGNLMVKEGIKISKSKGNGLPLFRVKKSIGADLYRLYLTISSNFDLILDFKQNEVDKLNKKLNRFVQISEKVLENYTSKEKINLKKLDEIDNWFISKFYSNVKNYFYYMEEVKIREAYTALFYETLTDITYYKKRANKSNFNLTISYMIKDFLILMTPTIPHTCEELYEKIKTSDKKFISTEKLKTNYQENINNNLLEKEEIIHRLVKKINVLIENKKDIKKINIFQAKNSRFDLFEKLKIMLKEKTSPKDIFSNLNKDFNSDMKFIKKFVPKCFKEGLQFYLNKNEELEFLNKTHKFLENEFNCEIQIIDLDNTDKILNSIPADFAIELE